MSVCFQIRQIGCKLDLLELSCIFKKIGVMNEK